MNRYFSADEIAEARNARGLNVPWNRNAGHCGVTVAELQAAMGEPQWKPGPGEPLCDL